MNSGVSIIMPVFNGEKYIREAIESVLAQTYTNFEFIIVDDGSTDKSNGIAESYRAQDARIRIFVTEENRGVVFALNRGVKEASGKYIARIDTDDIWTESKLEAQVRQLEADPELYLSATAKINIGENGNIREGEKYPQIFSYEEIRKKILRRNIFCHSSVVFRREILETVGMYNESYKNSEDYEYWIRVIHRHKVEILREPMVYYRISKDTISYNRLKEQRLYALRAKMMGRSLYQRSLFLLVYTIEDILYLLIPDFVFRFRRKHRDL